MKKIIIIVMGLILLGCNLENEKVNVYFCGGQSNANKHWYEGIKSEIVKYDPEAIVVHSFHPGDSILEWINDTDNLSADIAAIKSATAGYSYDIKGVFWFQGESDQPDQVYQGYLDRFNIMLSRFKTRINDRRFDMFITVVYDKYPNMIPIRNIQYKLISDNPNFYGIDSKDYVRMSDDIHVTESESYRLGTDTVNMYSYLF